MSKINKFRNSSRQDYLSQYCKISAFFLIFTILSFSDYLISSNAISETRELLMNERSLSKIQMNINFAFAALHEELSLVKPDVMIGKRNVLNFYLEELQIAKKGLIEKISRSWPSQFNSYQEDTRGFMFTDLCENFFKSRNAGECLSL